MEPKFIDKAKLNKEQLTDPDYRLRQLKKVFPGMPKDSCSKCHHCR